MKQLPLKNMGLEVKRNILILFSGKRMLHCFQIWVSAWHAKGDIMTLVGFGILALVEIFVAIPAISFMFGLNQRCEFSLVFLRWKYLCQIGSMLQIHCRSSKEEDISYSRSQEDFSLLLDYFTALPFYLTNVPERRLFYTGNYFISPRIKL